jgi:ferritin
MLKRGQAIEINFTASPPEHKWERPLDVFEQAFALENEYREHLNNLANIAREAKDELTVAMVVKMLDDQVESCNEYEVIVTKARAYSALPGLYYHLDKELGKGKGGR